MATLTGREVCEEVEAEYFIWSPAPADGAPPVSIEVHPDVMAGIARDVAENPSREIGGFLLGSVAPNEDQTARIRIDRYHRIACSHAAGPDFVLNAEDLAELEKTAASILSSGEFAAVGLYRSQLRPGLQLEPSDAGLISRYFREPFDLVLLIQDRPEGQMSGQFVIHGDDARMHLVGEAFPWKSVQSGFASPTMRSRRLVPDFVPDTVQPSRFRSSVNDDDPDSTGNLAERRRNWTKWWPVPLSLAVAGAALWLLVGTPGRINKPTPDPVAKTAGPVRPLGLYVSETGKTWQVSWNPNATALQDAGSVQLFVHAGDEQTRVDLLPKDLASGTYAYTPSANDVTFRLEVTAKNGQVSAESFRFVRQAPVTEAVKSPAAKEVQPSAPRATRKVPPSIPNNMRARIRGTVEISVRVRVDDHGRVVSATPLGKHAGIEAYLAGRAVEAAKAWQFEPARLNGKPTAGEQTLRFTFRK